MNVYLREWTMNLRSTQMMKIQKKNKILETLSYNSKSILNFKNRPLSFGINLLQEMLKKNFNK